MEPAPKSKTKKIVVLALDGGGVRGFYQIRMLRSLQQELRILRNEPNFKLLDHVDLIVGSGVGGVYAALLGLWRKLGGLPPANQAGQLSAIPPEPTPAGTPGPPDDLLEEAFQLTKKRLKLEARKGDSEFLADFYDPEVNAGKDLAKNPKNVAIVATDVTTQPKLHIFRNYKFPDQNAHSYQGTFIPPLRGTDDTPTFNAIIDALKATTATPGLRKKHEIKFSDTETRSFVDGGTLANNPVEIAFHEARLLFPGQDVGLIISVGTGIPIKDQDPKNIINFAGRAMVNLLNSSEVIESRFSVSLNSFPLPFSPVCIRLNPPEVGDIAIDEKDEDRYQYGNAMTRKYINSREFKSKTDLVYNALKQVYNEV